MIMLDLIHTITFYHFLLVQELFYAKCISVDEYHSSKRPLLQRLAVQGAEIESRDVIAARPTNNSEEEWSSIEFKDEKCLMGKESFHSKNKPKLRSPIEQIKGAASMISFVSSSKSGKTRGNRGTTNPSGEPLEHSDPNFPSTTSTANDFGPFNENPFREIPLKEIERETHSILMPASSPPPQIKAEKERGSTDKVKKKPFRTLFHREQRNENGGDPVPDPEERVAKSAKKQWGFDGFKKWNRSRLDDEAASLSLGEKSNDQASSTPCRLVSSPIGEGPDTKLIKKKIHSDGSASDFFIDKVESCRIHSFWFQFLVNTS